MKTSIVLATGASLLVLFAACEEKPPQAVEKPTPQTSNFETSRLGSAIDTYARNPTAENAADVDRAFAELDGEIAELDRQAGRTSGTEANEARTKADNLRTYRDKERLRYTEVQARVQTEKIRSGALDAGEKVEDAARKAGEGIQDAAEAVKDGVGDAVDAVKEKLP